MLNKPFENKLSGIEVITIEEHSPVGELLPVKAVLSNSVNKLNLGYIRGEKTTNATLMFCHEGITFFTNLHGLKSFIYSQAKPSQAKLECIVCREGTCLKLLPESWNLHDGFWKKE
ncbi:MAG: hypothetical protein KG029_17285 [Bacteroidetes bacterium]|nr:hypothetical protein [Bacteroidota bacterium]